MKPIQEEILKVLKERRATYATPVSSMELARRLNVNASYLRLQISSLKDNIGVRRGKHGGYFLRSL